MLSADVIPKTARIEVTIGSSRKALRKILTVLIGTELKPNSALVVDLSIWLSTTFRLSTLVGSGDKVEIMLRYAYMK